MTNYLVYLLEVSLCMGIFWGFYVLILRRLSFLTLRRSYLLFAAGLSWLLPLSNFSFTQGEGNHPLLEMGERVYILEQGMVEQVNALSMQIQQKGVYSTEQAESSLWSLPLETLLRWIYIAGVLFFLGKLVSGLFNVARLFFQIDWRKRSTYWLGITQEPTTFSFGPLLFLSTHQQSLPEEEFDSLVAHELAHIQQYHTLDILFLKIQQALCWINPLWIPWIKELRLVHECCADKAAARTSSKKEYAQFLLSLNQGQTVGQLTHAFAQVGLKTRIRTLLGPVSSRWSGLWMIPAIVLCLLLSAGFSFVRQGELIPSPFHHYFQELQQTIPPSSQDPYLAPLKDPQITSGYGMRKNPRTGKEQFHHGVDFRGPIGTPVYATGDGIVYMDLGLTDLSQGWFIEINHGEGLFSHYANLLHIRSEDSVPVRGGDQVKAGDLIGYIGNTSKTSTGPHLHYEIRRGKNRLNPMDFLPKNIQMGQAEEVLNSDLNGSVILRATPHLSPLKNPVLVSGYGNRKHPIFKVIKMHFGVDFLAKLNTEVYATGDGKVVTAGKSYGGYGYQIEIQHGIGVNEKGEDISLKTKYAHLAKDGILVEEGEQVKAGQLIGYSGNTGLSIGPHLHYEVIKGNKKVDPMDFMVGAFDEKDKESMD